MSALREDRGPEEFRVVRLTTHRRAIFHVFSCVKNCIRMAEGCQETLEVCRPSSPWTSVLERSSFTGFRKSFLPTMVRTAFAIPKSAARHFGIRVDPFQRRAWQYSALKIDFHTFPGVCCTRLNV